MADDPSVRVMGPSGMHDGAASATTAADERVAVVPSKRGGSFEHAPRFAAMRLCIDISAANRLAHGEQDGEAHTLDTYGAAHMLNAGGSAGREVG